jgi:outer membrane protein TolC
METNRFDTYTDTEWMVSQKLPWFGKRKARATVAELQAEVVGFQYLELMRKLIAQTKSAYWDLWLAQETVAVTRENRKLMEQFEAAARVRYETGAGMQADVLRAQVEVAKMSNDVVTMERELSIAQAAVNRLLNADTATPRRVEQAPPLHELPPSIEELQQRARKFCCILISFLRAKEAKAAAVKVAKLVSKPEFELRVEARQYNGRSGIREYDTGLFINFPWLWPGKYKAMVNEAKAEAEMAEAEFDNEVNATLLDIKEQYTRAENARRTIKLYEETVLPQVQALIQSTRAAFETGKASFLELIEAQRAWSAARLDYARARAQYGKEHAQLERNIAPWGPREFATGLVTPEMNEE